MGKDGRVKYYKKVGEEIPDQPQQGDYCIKHFVVIVHNLALLNIILLCVLLCAKDTGKLWPGFHSELFFAVLVLFLVLSYNLYPKINHPFIIRIMMLYN